MAGYHINIEKKTIENHYFREVLYTANHSQLVVMSLRPKEEIGMEVHESQDQFIRVEAGNGKAILNDQEYDLSDGIAVVIPAGTAHNIINQSSTDDLKLYTIYSPPHHKDKTIHRTRAEALTEED